jgi:hypothetical protein
MSVSMDKKRPSWRAWRPSLVMVMLGIGQALEQDAGHVKDDGM